MIDAESPSSTSQFHGAAAGAEEVVRLPAQPKTVRETGLEMYFLVELVARVMFASGKLHLPVLTGKLRLSINVLREVLCAMLSEQLVEVASRGDSDLDVNYQLTHAGKARAAESMQRCRYVGPAPVTLAAYGELMQRQSAALSQLPRVNAAGLSAVFGEDTVDPEVRDLVGAALQSTRSLLLYGASGSGKTALTHKLGRLQQGVVAVPYAILIEHAIVLVHDPLRHLAPTAQLARQGEDRRSMDARWCLCQRPVITVGAELCPDMLDLRYDAVSGVYQAPAHFLANSGMLVVDDLGRQRMPVSDLLNRFSSALDSGADHLTLDGGHRVGVPFDLTMVFVTNIAPGLLLDDASMRRMAYKIPVGALSESHYRALFRRQCRLTRIACDDAVVEYLLTCLHASTGRALLASYPRELLNRIADFASFAGVQPRLTVPALEQAWSSMFAACSTAAPLSAPSHPSIPFLANCGDPLLERIS